YDPTSYLQRLKQDFPSIWVEKILTGKEDLLKEWPVEGTTGYEFIQFTNHLMVDRSEFDKIEHHWKGKIQNRWKNFADCTADCKEYVLHELFPSELKRLVE